MGCTFKASEDVLHSHGLLLKTSEAVRFKKEGENVFSIVNYSNSKKPYKQFLKTKNIIKRFYYVSHKLQIEITKDFYDKPLVLNNWDDAREIVLTILFTKTLLSLYVSNKHVFEDYCDEIQKQKENRLKKILLHIKYNDSQNKWETVEPHNMAELTTEEQSSLQEYLQDLNLLMQGKHPPIIYQYVSEYYYIIDTLKKEINAELDSNLFYSKNVYEEIIEKDFPKHIHDFKKIIFIVEVYNMSVGEKSPEKTVKKILHNISKKTNSIDIMAEIRKTMDFLIKFHDQDADAMQLKTVFFEFWKKAYYCANVVYMRDIFEDAFAKHLSVIIKEFETLEKTIQFDKLPYQTKIKIVELIKLISSNECCYNIVEIKNKVETFKQVIGSNFNA